MVANMSSPAMKIHISLGPLDHSPPRNYTTSITYIPLKSGRSPSEAFKVLHEGLHRTLYHLPWLSGKVYPQSPDTPGWRPGQLEIRHDPVDMEGPRPSQLRFKQLESGPDYEELKESAFPTEQFEDGELFPGGLIPDVSKGADVFVAQANFVPGGCLLTAAIFHAASDGVALFTVSKLWADNCEALQSDRPMAELPPESSDRMLPGQIWTEEAAECKKSAHEIGFGPRHLLGLGATEPATRAASQVASQRLAQLLSQVGPKQPPPAPEQAKRKMLSAIFYISGANFSRLLKDCVGKNTPDAQVSANDAICALVWRSLLKARRRAKASEAETHPDPDASARLDMIIDGRLSFSPSVPPSYLGNLTATVQPRLPLSVLTLPSTTLASVARVIRHAFGGVNQDQLFDAYALLDAWPDFDELQAQKNQRRSGLHGHSLLVTSLLAMPLYTHVSFGGGVFANGGKPDAVRPLMGAFKHAARLCFILPRRTHGAVEFVINMFEDEMELLLKDEEFTNYAMFLC